MKQTIDLKVNGQTYEVETQPWRTLAEVLRDQLHLTGTKISCAEGHCGACTIIVNGKAVNSCLMLIGEAQGKEILTIEGVSKGGELHPIQDAFVTHGAVQCGFCTPGLIMGTKAFLLENPDPSDEEIKKVLSGHLCRCTGYVQVIEAVKVAAENLRSSQNEGR
ncbi:MAG: (2Fe-2S)-binding protein [Desulfobacteraceae bacterium]